MVSNTSTEYCSGCDDVLLDGRGSLSLNTDFSARVTNSGARPVRASLPCTEHLITLFYYFVFCGVFPVVRKLVVGLRVI